MYENCSHKTATPPCDVLISCFTETVTVQSERSQKLITAGIFVIQDAKHWVTSELLQKVTKSARRNLDACITKIIVLSQKRASGVYDIYLHLIYLFCLISFRSAVLVHDTFVTGTAKS